jgi:hypothetical protein
VVFYCALIGLEEACDKAIDRLIQKDEALKNKAGILTIAAKASVPLTAATLIAKLSELGSLRHAKIAALTGLTPFNRARIPATSKAEEKSSETSSTWRPYPL